MEQDEGTEIRSTILDIKRQDFFYEMDGGGEHQKRRPKGKESACG